MRGTRTHRDAPDWVGLLGQRRRKHQRARSRRLASLESLEPRQVLTGVPIISELLASNGSIIEDQDGDDSDFIELYNAGDDDMSLNRYYLTDDPNDLQKWRFPDVNLATGEYLVVYASDKDRNDPDNQLHANFRLSRTGEFLALVEPDGQTIAHSYSPGFPDQVTDVSYGVPTGLKKSTLVDGNAAARVLIPTDGSLDVSEPDVVAGTWLEVGFDDSGANWFDANLGVGFVPPDTPVVLADTVADFSGVQGQDNWYYGTWIKNLDADGAYTPSDFTEANGERFFDIATNSWSFSPRSTSITPQGGHPGSATVAGLNEWPLRRWISETEGEITINGTLANDDAAGDGVVGRIWVNDTEVYQQAVNGTSTDFSVTATVAVGDVVDFAIDLGEALDETGDATTFTAQISGRALQTFPEVSLAASTDDWERTTEQGIKNWYYGYSDRSADADQIYQASDMQIFSAAFWNGTSRWEFPDPSIDTQVRSNSVAPHGSDGVVHWAIKRWVSNHDGTLVVEYDFSKSAIGGDGVTGHLFHNGVEVDSVQVDGNDRTGTTRRVLIENVAQGDTIDFAVDPLGPGVDPQQIDGTTDRSNIDIRIARVADLSESITTDIRDQMNGVGSSAYLRVPFTVEDVSALDELTLKMKYDDGFVAYVNGQPVASSNAPGEIGFASAAVEDRAVEDATVFETFDITDHRGLFVNGENVLQIHVLNSSASDDDLLAMPVLEIGTLTAEIGQARYFAVPSPGAPNGLGADAVGPLVLNPTHSPDAPLETDPIVVTAAVTQTFDAVADVTLTYRPMFADSVTIAMMDDGQGSDATAGDGIYTAVIPAGTAQPGEMIRWFITAKDANGLSGRAPAFVNPTKDQQYLGTMVADPTIESKLPVYHWFVESPNRAGTAGGEYGSIYYNGEFYDNVHFELHGQSSSGFPKKSYNVDFPNDHRLLLNDDLPRLEDINWLTNYADKSLMRNTLGYEQRAMTGGASHLAFPIRVEQNGEFFAVYDFVEDPDERWLERLGFDPNGSLYKIYNTFNSAGGAEKKAGPTDDATDLQDVIAGVQLRGDEGLNYIMDNVNIAQMVNYTAGFAITSNRDCCHKNFYAYRDTDGTGEWWFLPWDVDLSQGRNWGGFGLAYFDDTMYPDNSLQVGGNNTLITKLYSSIPGFQDMFHRRLRTLMDDYIKAPGTPQDEIPFESRIDELYDLLKADADLHNEKNPANWGQTGIQTFDEAVNILLTEYVEPRRQFLYSQVVSDAGDAPVILSGEPGAVTGTYLIPTDDTLGREWTTLGFDDSSWASGPMGIGFELDNDHYVDLIATDLGEEVLGSSSLYARIPFQIDDPSTMSGLSLRMKYEDGYVAYINGVEVHRQGLRQDDPTFDSTSTSRSNRVAVDFENVNISQHLSALQPGENILAIQGLNSSATSRDMFFLPELVEGALTSGRGDIPVAQKGNPQIDFGMFDFNPSSGNQAEEYIQLVNNSDVSVDISGWSLAGDVQWTFDPGTVLPAGFTLYATPDAKAFRARAEGPTGGMQLFVQGNYDGNLPNIGGTVQLVAPDGEIVNETTYVGTTSPVQEYLRISEVMYNPLNASASELAVDDSLASEDFEYIELVNISGTETLDIGGVQFANGVEFNFTGAPITQLAPGERVLVVRNTEAFATRYGQDVVSRVAGIFASNTALRDTGEQITLLTNDGSVVVDFTYSDNSYQGWPSRADGAGSSLQIVDPLGDYEEPTNWRASTEISGSPGADAADPLTGLRINEVLSRSVAPQTDQIELWNTSGEAVSLVNYFLSDSAANRDALKKYAFSDVTVASQEYLVLSEQQFNPGGGENPNDFALSGDGGDQLYLTVGDANGPTHFVDSVEFGASMDGETFSRGENGMLYPASPTLGAANSLPRVGPLVVTEIMAAPSSPSAEAIATDPSISVDNLEYVELFNPTGLAVDLTNWRIRLGVDFDFDPATQLEAGETLLVVPFNSDNSIRVAAFRAHYQLSDSVAIVGGYAGQLSSTGDGVQLQHPGAPSADGSIPRLLEDELVYDNLAPWPVDAFSGGRSLTRIAASAYGNDASSWVAADPSPGQFGGDIAGDLTNDGRVDGQDADVLHEALRNGDTLGDLDGNGLTDVDDLIYFVENIVGTSVGDVNFDGNFDSNDLIQLFAINEFEDAAAGNSTYTDGDWNLNGEFDSEDLLFALERMGYDGGGPPAEVAAAIAAESIHPANSLSDMDDQEVLADPSDRRPVRLDDATHDLIFADFESQASTNDSSAGKELDLFGEEFDRIVV